MKTNRSWKWLLGLGLAIAVSMSAMAQDGRGHRKHNGDRGKHRMEQGGKRDLSEKIYRVTQADSVQKQKMKPAIDKTSKRLESLRLSYRKQEQQTLDSLKLKLKPFLKEEQLKKLNDWNSKTSKP